MTIKLATIGLLLAFAWAFVASGDLGKVVDRFQRPKEKPSVRQIKSSLGDMPTDRRIKHPLGETEVPLSPQRIASLSSAGTDSLSRIGVRPVLATTSWKDENAVSYLGDRLQGVKLIRQTGSVNLEEVLAAKPDLILANSRDARLFSQLSKIAPTLCLASDGSGDRENRILDVGDVVGQPDAARARRDEYRRHVERSQSHARRPRGRTNGRLPPLPPQHLRHLHASLDVRPAPVRAARPHSGPSHARRLCRAAVGMCSPSSGSRP